MLITCSLVLPQSHMSVIVFRWLLISFIMNPEQLPQFPSRLPNISHHVRPTCPPERRRLHRDIVCSPLLSSSHLQQLYKRGLLPALLIFNVFITAPVFGSKFKDFPLCDPSLVLFLISWFWFLMMGVSMFSCNPYWSIKEVKNKP